MSLEGKTAPAFELEGSDRKKHALKNYKGKTVILYFYPKDNTPGCTKEACGFREIFKTIKEMDILLFGVSKDSLASHDKFIKDFGLPFILLSDPDAKMMKKYEAYGEKMMYGKKTIGTIRSTVIIGPDGKVMKHWGKIMKAEEHPAEVREFLKKGT